ncbi:MAG: serpin family protein [Candidatus Obscuribacterales bacterium]|nr:serpin family protein [Candidatus Obscuribacterales bacterium]
MHKWKKAFTLAALAAFAGTDCLGSQPGTPDSSPFAIDLFKAVAAKKANENVLVSPLSACTALTMTYTGADGETEKAMGKTLGISNKQEAAAQTKARLEALRNPGSKTKLEIANALFGDKNIAFRPDFLKTTKENFQAELNSLDFANAEATLKTINGWVATQTHGKITSILDSIGQDAILYLVNAVYFKGLWSEPFDKKQTNSETFFGPDKAEKVPTMHMHSDDFQYFETPEFQALMLPYNDKRLSLLIFLPAKDKTLQSFEKSLDQKKFESFTQAFRKREGSLSLPKFKIEDKMLLNDPLTKMGMGIAFDPEKADFKKMVNLKANVYISKVLHKTFMEVNEEGTEAAAVTAVEMSVATAMMPTHPPFEMKVNRPFFIALRDWKTGAVLFAGHVVKPK